MIITERLSDDQMWMWSAKMSKLFCFLGLLFCRFDSEPDAPEITSGEYISYRIQPPYNTDYTVFEDNFDF